MAEGGTVKSGGLSEGDALEPAPVPADSTLESNVVDGDMVDGVTAGRGDGAAVGGSIDGVVGGGAVCSADRAGSGNSAAVVGSAVEVEGGASEEDSD